MPGGFPRDGRACQRGLRPRRAGVQCWVLSHREEIAGPLVVLAQEGVQNAISVLVYRYQYFRIGLILLGTYAFCLEDLAKAGKVIDTCIERADRVVKKLQGGLQRRD